MKTVKLRNGSEEASSLVKIVNTAINNWQGLDLALKFYDIVTMCRDSSYTPFTPTLEEFKRLSLVGPDGSIHSSIKNIILSMAEGDGLNLSIVDPRVDPSAIIEDTL
ncbi:MAG: hypothetical protein J3T61_00055 [Candidatus Brocadiales bacterium]|nr:hypothetical protein [Candidatus Bathyanammoxibius sp.]